MLVEESVKAPTEPVSRRLLLAAALDGDVACVADNASDWMFHCHVLEHQDGGMMSVNRVT